MKLNTVKNIAPNKNLFKKIATLLISITVIIISFIVLTNADKAAKDTVSVIRIKASEGLPAYSMITEDNIEKYSIIRKEYNKDMILAEDIEDALNKYNQYFLRDKSIIHKDQITDVRPKINEWLYELDDEYEILILPFNNVELGGSILKPGDQVRIRVSYESDEEDTDTANDFDDFNPNLGNQSNNKRNIKTDMLFESIEIIDMLNANNYSIYEMYKDILNLSEDERHEIMQSEDFIKNTQPRALVLKGSREQIDTYASYITHTNNTFLITILSRRTSGVLIDQFPGNR
ncbi:hypothetical protein [Alkaliphilus transvaalensis]|uniref:hypothetical protein n=1 Tax=Alkaliphilus transvaalensis TaxID=114628 RepID=UPI000688DB2D|nr:hypothetical protein [Alkaliphilus transvaalensis]